MSLAEYEKIIVHCGIHKTGSSYLQGILDRKTDILREWGWEFPPTKRGTGNHSIIAVSYREDVSIDKLFSRFINLESDCSTLLLSGEEFYRHLPRENFLGKFLQAASNANVQFVFYLRRPDHLLESVYAQSVKRWYCGDIAGVKYPFNFYKTVRPFVEAVGRENVTIRPYNRKLWPNGQLGADFCAAIGEPELWEAIAPASEVFTNVSLTRDETFLLSRFKGRAAKQRLLEYFIANPMPTFENSTKFFMSPQERRQFNSMYATAYQRVGDMFQLGDMEEFLGIDEGYQDPGWQPYIPDWQKLFHYMTKFADDTI